MPQCFGHRRARKSLGPQPIDEIDILVVGRCEAELTKEIALPREPLQPIKKQVSIAIGYKDVSYAPVMRVAVGLLDYI